MRSASRLRRVPLTAVNERPTAVPNGPRSEEAARALPTGKGDPIHHPSAYGYSGRRVTATGWRNYLNLFYCAEPDVKDLSVPLCQRAGYFRNKLNNFGVGFFFLFCGLAVRFVTANKSEKLSARIRQRISQPVKKSTISSFPAVRLQIVHGVRRPGKQTAQAKATAQHFCRLTEFAF